MRRFLSAAPVSEIGRGSRPAGNGRRSLFPAGFFPELRALDGDRGGRRVISAHPEALYAVPVPAEELTDTDRPEDLERLE